ncbi:MAG: hypothetical protein V4691_00100 [Pseudomonadota bacterium]
MRGRIKVARLLLCKSGLVNIRAKLMPKSKIAMAHFELIQNPASEWWYGDVIVLGLCV